MANMTQRQASSRIPNSTDEPEEPLSSGEIMPNIFLKKLEMLMGLG